MVLLHQYAGRETARRIAPHWRAGAYCLLERKKDKGTVLLQASGWDSAASAANFFRAYRRVLRGKWSKMEVSEDAPARLAGVGDDGNFLLLVAGRNVYCVEGLRRPDDVRPIPVR